MKRREWMERTIAAGTALAWSSPALEAFSSGEQSHAIIDTNVNLFAWPFRDLPLNSPQKLVRKLQSLGINSAWAGSFEAILHRDLSAVNERLAHACRDHVELVPIGTVNPASSGWETDLQTCIHQHHMPGIRLYPGYHEYRLDTPAFISFLEQAFAAHLFVQIVAALEDLRTQPQLLQVSDVDLQPLTQCLPAFPQGRMQILNARPSAKLLGTLAELPGLYWDTARLEGTAGVPNLVRSVPTGRVLFGSHAPFLIPEAALIRVHESDQLDELQLQAVYRDNAAQFLERTRT